MTLFHSPLLQKPVTATLEIPGSKSYTNRALLMAALTEEPVTLYNPLYSEDTVAMVGCLRTLGIRIDTEPGYMIVYGDRGQIQNRSYELFAHDSGTTIRFILALLCLAPGTQIIRGSDRLSKRPIQDLVETLRLLGAQIEYLEKEGAAPLKVCSSRLYSGAEVTIDASVSSQFLSALLMIAPCLNGLTVQMQGKIISRPYVEMTLQAMRDWGISVAQIEEGRYFIPAGQHYTKKQYVIEGDFSSAGYFFAIAALTQSTLTLKNLAPDSAQADRKFLNILARMGNEMSWSDQGITLVGKHILPLTLDMEDCPDQVQTMAVLAAFARGVTRISGVRSLRVKETERVQALKKELAKMGIQTEDTHNTLTIYGGEPRAATIDTYGDHRMAMAFAVAGTRLPGMQIRHPEVVNKTFPTFWSILRSL